MGIGLKVAALVAATATLIAVPAAAAQASVKRTTTEAVTVTWQDNDKGEEFLVITRGGVARNSVYLEDDTGNQYWSRYGAMEGLDGRPVDAFYDYDNDRYYVKLKTALGILNDNVEGQYVADLLDPRLGDEPAKAEIAALTAAFKAGGKTYLAIDGKQDTMAKYGEMSPIVAQLEWAKFLSDSSEGDYTYDDKCKDVQGLEVCTTRFTGNVKANGTNAVVFRVWFNSDGTLDGARIVDGKGRVIAKDDVNWASTDAITIPSADSSFYIDLL